MGLVPLRHSRSDGELGSADHPHFRGREPPGYASGGQPAQLSARIGFEGPVSAWGFSPWSV